MELPYEKIKRIGSGAQGECYLVEHFPSASQCVMKRVTLDTVTSKQRREAINEIDFLQRLHHPMIIKFVDSFAEENSETVCIFTEYADKGDLRKLIVQKSAMSDTLNYNNSLDSNIFREKDKDTGDKDVVTQKNDGQTEETKEKEKEEIQEEKGTLNKELTDSLNDSNSFIDPYFSEDHVMFIFVQILLGLEVLHSHQILHRDLKTENIFLTSSGFVKLGDFGISKQLTPETTFAETFVGTPSYMSPEAHRKQLYDGKSDMWALGCVLYEICSLKRAFEGDNVAQVVVSVLASGRRCLSPQRYSPDLQALLNSLLQVDPDLRPCATHLLQSYFLQSHICRIIHQYRRKLPKLCRILRKRLQRNRNSVQYLSPEIPRHVADLCEITPGPSRSFSISYLAKPTPITTRSTYSSTKQAVMDHPTHKATTLEVEDDMDSLMCRKSSSKSRSSFCTSSRGKLSAPFPPPNLHVDIEDVATFFPVLPSQKQNFCAIVDFDDDEEEDEEDDDISPENSQDLLAVIPWAQLTERRSCSSTSSVAGCGSNEDLFVIPTSVSVASSGSYSSNLHLILQKALSGPCSLAASQSMTSFQSDHIDSKSEGQEPMENGAADSSKSE